MHDAMHTRIRDGRGFLAALDQSGGSTPKALEAYGIEGDAYADDQAMFDLVHAMRCRIITSPSFTGDRVLGAILFEGTMDRHVDGVPTATYLWSTKGIVPFVKIDKGLADTTDGVQLMKPMPQLDGLLARAREHGVFGTKMRSVIHRADAAGIAAVVAQQAAVARRILDAGLVPILEPEVDIGAADKVEAEQLLRDELLDAVGTMPAPVMLKLTIPSEDGFYAPLMDHANVLRVVALSGGYARDEATERLARNPGLIASFSRVLVAELTHQQTDEEFDEVLDVTIRSVYDASLT